MRLKMARVDQDRSASVCCIDTNITLNYLCSKLVTLDDDAVLDHS